MSRGPWRRSWPRGDNSLSKEFPRLARARSSPRLVSASFVGAAVAAQWFSHCCLAPAGVSAPPARSPLDVVGASKIAGVGVINLDQSECSAHENCARVSGPITFRRIGTLLPMLVLPAIGCAAGVDSSPPWYSQLSITDGVGGVRDWRSPTRRLSLSLGSCVLGIGKALSFNTPSDFSSSFEKVDEQSLLFSQNERGPCLGLVVLSHLLSVAGLGLDSSCSGSPRLSCSGAP